MKWIKTILIGIIATFSMDLIMNIGMLGFGFAPTNIHPAAAFLYNLGIEQQLLGVLLHYCYGTLWALVFVYAFDGHYSIKRALQLAGILWLFMMLVYSPVIGWGFFGYGNATLLQNHHPLYLSSTIGYISLTFLVHLAYGLVLGMLTGRFFPQKNNVR